VQGCHGWGGVGEKHVYLQQLILQVMKLSLLLFAVFREFVNRFLFLGEIIFNFPEIGFLFISEGCKILQDFFFMIDLISNLRKASRPNQQKYTKIQTKNYQAKYTKRRLKR
jgi:hypothetical protein